MFHNELDKTVKYICTSEFKSRKRTNIARNNRETLDSPATILTSLSSGDNVFTRQATQGFIVVVVVVVVVVAQTIDAESIASEQMRLPLEEAMLE